MDKAIAQYGNNKSCYVEKAFLDSVCKLHREEICNVTWSLQISELVQLHKSKLQLWKAVVVNCDQRPAQLRGKSRHQMRTKVSEVQLHSPAFVVC